MKAAIRRTYGLPNQISIENIKKPVPKDNEVLIKMYATTVNRTDCANLTAKPYIMRFVLGLFKPRQIASTAFIVVNVHLISYTWIPWLAPTAIGTPLIIYWTWIYSSKRKRAS